jgi:pimeloyl-ACP methyl ester carboxylesterase
VLDATATERAHVVGMSAGGWIAQLLALGHPSGSRRSRSSPAGRTRPARSTTTSPGTTTRSWR